MANNQLPKFHMGLYNYKFDITQRSVRLIRTLVLHGMVHQCFVVACCFMNMFLRNQRRRQYTGCKFLK